MIQSVQHNFLTIQMFSLAVILGPIMAQKWILKRQVVSFIPVSFRVQASHILDSGSLLRTMTHLELTSIARNTFIDYLTRTLFFIQWAQTNCADWSSASDLDTSLVLFFEELFWKQVSAAEGSKFIAGLKFVYPQLAKLGGVNQPRSVRALRAWEKIRPNVQRFPLPWICLCAILGDLIHHNRIQTALCLLIQYITYLRPGVCDRLTVTQLVPPAGIQSANSQAWGILLYPSEYKIPGKTGGYDLSVLLDTHRWLDQFLVVLSANRRPDAPLWGVSGAIVRQDFLNAVFRLKL